MLLTPRDPLELEGDLPPVVAMASLLPRDYSHAMHRHRRERLTFTDAGVMVVCTPQGNWVVPPHCAVWIPAQMDHYIQARDPLDKRSIDIASGQVTGMASDACCVVQVSPLLRELTNSAVRMPLSASHSSRAEKILSLMCDEISSLPAASLYLPLPADRRLQRIAQALLADPGSDRTIDDWGTLVGASGRTLARLFVRETGLTFGAWRRQARLLDALSKLSDGQSVSSVARALGYDNPSSFTTMFKQALGTSPGKYFSRDVAD